MSRSRYTRLVHERDEVQRERQVRALAHLARDLRRPPAEILVPPAVEVAAVVDLKVRRRARLEQKRLFKSAPALAASA